MKALISTGEPSGSGYRVAQVEQDGNIFPVASELFWVDCPDNTVADRFWYDPNTESFVAFPEPVFEENIAQPISSGSQTL